MVNVVDPKRTEESLDMNEVSRKNSTGDLSAIKLSTRDERILVSFYDGECGKLAQRRAKKMLTRSIAAREFMQALRLITTELHAGDERNAGSCDLWSRISARIEAEEHAEMLHNDRVPSSASRASVVFNALKNAEWRPRITWGISGAAVASACSVMLIQFGVVGNFKSTGKQTLANPAAIAGNFNSSLANPPLVSGASFSDDQPRETSNPMEVDWMRSAGRVKLLEDSSERSPIIWVNPPASKTSQLAFSSEYYSSAENNSRRVGRSNTHIPVAIPASGPLR